MLTGHPREEILYAFVDGELSPAEAMEVSGHVDTCARCGAIVADARGFAAAATRIVGALDAAPRGAVPMRRAHRLPPWLAAAAVMVLAVGTSSIVFRSRSGTSERVETAARAAAVDAPVPQAEAGTAITLQGANVDRPTAAAGERPAPAAGPRRGLATAAEQRAPLAERTDATRDTRAPAPAPSAPAAQTDFAGRGVAGGIGAVRGEPSETTDSLRLRGGDVFTEVVVTGAGPNARRAEAAGARQIAAAATTPPAARAPLRIVRYQARPGVIVELREFDVPVPSFAPPPGLNQFRWSDPAGTRAYVLTGALTEAELAALAPRLGDLPVVR